MARLREPVYLGHDDEVSVTLTDVAADGTETAVDLSVLSRMVLTLRVEGGSRLAATVDTDEVSGAIDYSAGSGRVDFTLGKTLESQSVEPGDYSVRLVGIDGAGNETTLIHEASTDSQLVLEVAQGVDV